jgi:hypothetical protein
MAILQEHTTHKYVFPRQPGVFLPKSTSYLDKLGACPWETAAFVADFRWKRCTERKIFSQEVPDIKACAKILESLPRRTFLPPYKGKFTPDLPPQALNIERFVFLARTLPLDLEEDLIKSVTDGLINNWSTHYRGFGGWVQDFSIPQLPNEDRIEEQIMQDVDTGRVVGPFDRPPFPNSWCRQQPKICRMFSIKKNKYDPFDPAIRVIFDKSFPHPYSKNDLTPRTDAGQEYWTFAKFLAEVAKLGPNTLMFFADVKAAYKTLSVKPEEWFLQVLRIGKKYFVDKTGVFGDVAAGDNWDRMMRVDLRIAQVRLGLLWLRYYVDNSSNLTPHLPNGQPDFIRANHEFKTFLQHYEYINMPLHHIIGPTLYIESHLGWGVDTKNMIVFIKEERKKFLLENLQKHITRSARGPFYSILKSHFDSLIGIINFCAQVIRCLRAPLKHLFAKQAEYDKLGTECKKVVLKKRDNFVCRWLHFYLQQWSGITAITATVWQEPQIFIWTDAGNQATHGGEVWGIGAWCRELGSFISEPWDQKTLQLAKSKKSGELSVPFLESYSIMAAVLSLSPDHSHVLVHTDCAPAANICSGRWSKTSDTLNNFIGFFDFECTKRDIVFQVVHVPREENFGAHYLSQGMIEKAGTFVTLNKQVEITALKGLF